MSDPIKSVIEQLEKGTEEIDKLKKKQVIVGFFGDRDSKLLTIVRANEYGAHIVPKNSSGYLWVPNKKVLKNLHNPDKPGDIKGLFVPKGKKVAVIIDEAGTMQICYWLLKKVDIPARPFIRTAFIKNQTKYKETVTKGIQSFFNGKMTADRLLNQLGNMAVADIRKSARDWDTPKNAPITVSNKDDTDNPLVDNGELNRKVTYVVSSIGSDLD